MRICVASLESMTPYSQSKAYISTRGEKETADAFEKAHWREKAHVNEAGEVFIPAMAFKFALDESCKRLAIQVPGQGKTRYTKFFEAGVYVPEGPSLGIKIDDVKGEWVFCNSDGKRGSGSRVMRCFPVIPAWKADVTFMVLDDKIPQDIFERVLKECGLYVGIGRFRPQNQGYFGRFTVKAAKWSEV